MRHFLTAGLIILAGGFLENREHRDGVHVPFSASLFIILAIFAVVCFYLFSSCTQNCLLGKANSAVSTVLGDGCGCCSSNLALSM